MRRPALCGRSISSDAAERSLRKHLNEPEHAVVEEVLSDSTDHKIGARNGKRTTSTRSRTPMEGLPTIGSTWFVVRLVYHPTPAHAPRTVRGSPSGSDS